MPESLGTAHVSGRIIVVSKPKISVWPDGSTIPKITDVYGIFRKALLKSFCQTHKLT
jgi:hypothetical protein